MILFWIDYQKNTDKLLPSYLLDVEPLTIIGNDPSGKTVSGLITDGKDSDQACLLSCPLLQGFISQHYRMSQFVTIPMTYKETETWTYFSMKTIIQWSQLNSSTTSSLESSINLKNNF